MYWHYFVIGSFILAIIISQIRIYRQTKKKRKQFEGIFPNKAEEEWLVLKTEGVQIISQKLYDAHERKTELQKLIEQTNKKNDKSINTSDKKKAGLEKELETTNDKIEALNNLYETLQNTTRKEIIDSINRYLEKNKDGVTDFNLIRDIIDRNCDAIEEEIQTQRALRHAERPGRQVADGCEVCPCCLLCRHGWGQILPVHHDRRGVQRALYLCLQRTEQLFNRGFYETGNHLFWVCTGDDPDGQRR